MIVLIAAMDFSEKTAAAEAVSVLEELGIPYRKADLGPEMLKNEEGIVDAVTGTTHTCLISTPQEGKSPAYYFVVGLALGRGEKKFLYRRDGASLLTRFEEKVCLGTGIEELRAFLGEEKKRYTATRAVTAAKEELEREGISFTRESLWACAEEGKSRLMGLFLAGGFPADSMNNRGVPLLNLAARGGHTETALILLEGGALLDKIANDNGNTALMDAIAAGAVELGEAIIKAGADVDIQSKNGQSALILAVSRGFSEVAGMLLTHGANTELVDNLGMTALKYAELFKHTDILERLKQSAA